MKICEKPSVESKSDYNTCPTELTDSHEAELRINKKNSRAIQVSKGLSRIRIAD
jgi:hypothetical protein